MRKVSLVTLALLLVLSVMSAWATAEQEPAAAADGASSFEGMTCDVIYMAVGGHTETEQLVGEFEEMYGVTVNFDMLTPQQYDTKLDTELIPRTGAYDAAWIPWRTYHRWIAAGWFAPLNEFIDDPNLVDEEQLGMDGFFPAAVQSLTTPDGDIMALPVFNDGVVFAYRSDLYEEAGLTTAPDTWDEVAEYAAKLTNDEVAGYSMRTSRSGGGLGWMVPMLLQAWGGGVIVDYPDNWSANLLSEESIAASEWYVDTITANTFDGGLTAHWVEMVNAFSQGYLAQMPEAWVLMGQVLDPEKSLVYENTAFAMPPAGPAQRIASGAVHGLGVPANSPEKELGYKFIEWVLSESTQRRNLVENTSTTVTRPVLMDTPEYMDVFPVAGENFVSTVKQSLNEAVDAMFRPMSPVWREVEEQLGIAYSSVLAGQIDLMPALETADAEITRIHTEAGFDVQ